MTADATKQATLDVKIGDVEFAGSGDQSWLAEQLKAVVDAAPKIVRTQPTGAKDAKLNEQPSGSAFSTSLATYIREKKADGNQNLRFLATADWLRRREPSVILTTAMVSKALQDNQQKRLGNPADCLNQNVAKGLCEKAKGGFFITPEGLRALGSG